MNVKHIAKIATGDFGEVRKVTLNDVLFNVVSR